MLERLQKLKDRGVLAIESEDYGTVIVQCYRFPDFDCQNQDMADFTTYYVDIQGDKTVFDSAESVYEYLQEMFVVDEAVS